MYTSVAFRCGKFPPYEGEDQDINPGLWGKRLAEYISQKLPEYGFVMHEMIAEDWGYYIPIHNKGFKLALCCAHQFGEKDDQFLIFSDPKKPKIRKLFRTIDASSQLSQLMNALRKILENDPNICQIEWE